MPVTSFGLFSLRVAIAAAAVLLAWMAANLLSRRRALDEDAAAGGPLLDAVLAGLLAARVGYVLRWWPEYAAAPASIIAIGDGGFAWWSGLPVALAVAGWRSRRMPSLRLPVVAGLLIGMTCWWMAVSVLDARQRDAIPMPELALRTLDGAPLVIPDADPRPIVINLWATWCPPCRREMPMFAQAGVRWPQVRFLLLNQGDEPDLVADYLRRNGLEAADVLLDPGSEAMRATGAKVLPTTLFYDADGRLRDLHVGELSAAALTDRLQRYFDVEPGAARQAPVPMGQ